MKGPVNNFVASLHRMQTQTADAPRRTTHGSCAWMLPFSNTSSLRQPQDGAARDGALTAVVPAVVPARLKPLRNAAPDTDDDRLSGATRSLANRILGLNGFAVRRPVLEVEPERYFAESLRMPRVEAIRKTTDVIRGIRTQVA